MIKLNFVSGIILGSAIAVAGAFAPTVSDAASVADFYKSKRMKIIVGSGAGGGYDTYARTMARHLGNFIPGKPDFLVQNKVGAASIVAANYVYNVAPQDGTVIGAIQRTAPMIQILGRKGPRFDPIKFYWIGSLSSEAGMISLMKTAKVQKFEDAFTTEAVMGSTGPNDLEQIPALINNTLGTKFRIVRGYPATPAVHLSMQRGEVDGISQSWSSFSLLNAKLISDNRINVLVQVSLKKDPTMTAMGVPMIGKFITRERVLPNLKVADVKTYFSLVLTNKAMGRPYVMGPGVPKDRIAAVRKAFMDMAADKAFIKDAKRQKRTIIPVSGQEVQDMVIKIASAPKAVLANVEKMTNYRGKVKTVKIELPRHTGKVTKVKRGGRRIYIMYKGKEVKAKVSGSRSKVSINGKKVKRKSVKPGMTCTLVYSGPGTEATHIICKK